MAAIEAQLRAAQAALGFPRGRWSRHEALVASKFVSAARVDAARAAKARDPAQVDAARQQLATFRATLGRQPEVRAAQADVEAAAAQVAQRKWQVDQQGRHRRQVPGEITEIYYRPGEWVAAGAPVVSLLPDARRRVRFFVPETAIATLKPGQKVRSPLRRLRRADPRHHRLHRAAGRIHAAGHLQPRQPRKLVFRVEAAAAPEQAPTLRPGLPVDVRLVEH